MMNYVRSNALRWYHHVRTNYNGVEVIVQAGVMSATASSVIDSNGRSGSVRLKKTVQKEQKQNNNFSFFFFFF